jgi:TonB family protein
MRHRRYLVAVSLVAHLAFVLVLFVVGFWQLERLESPRHRVDLAVASPPPPAPAGSPAGAKVQFDRKKPKVIAHDIVVAPKPDPDTVPTPAPQTPGTGAGSGSGTGSGSGNPDSTGTCTEAPCGDPDDHPATRQDEVVAKKEPIPVIPSVIRGMRIAGETQIQPPDVEKTALLRSGHPRAAATVKVCVGEAGSVTSLSMFKGSGYPGWDRAILAAMRDWRYKAHQIDGKPVSVCGMVTFLYEIH